MGKRFTAAQMEFLKGDVTPEEYDILLEADDPVYWSEKHLRDPDKGDEPFKVKVPFYDFLRDNRKDRGLRVGRQFGKTVHFSVDILHTLLYNSNLVLLVLVPSKKNMNRMLEIINNLIRQSDVKSEYTMSKSKTKSANNDIEPEFDYQITCSSGSVCRFFFMGSNPDKARGQRAKGIIYLDEVEYFPEKAFPVITGYLKADPTIKIVASSTPRGIEGSWFREFCDRCSDPKYVDGVEYHLPTTLETNWPEVEARLREVIFDEITWKLEVLAEWAEAKGAVYRREIINDAIERSKINGRFFSMEELRSTSEYEIANKFLGVDWNIPQNGVRIVEMANMFGRLMITRHERISHEVYTQTYTVDRIIELEKQHKYRVISVDTGYGATQIELLHKRLVEMGIEPTKVMNPVDSSSRVEIEIIYESPMTGARKKDTIAVRTKTHIVGLLGKYLESALTLPEEEDIKEGLVREVRNFRRKATTAEQGNNFIYSENTHSLSALQVLLHGYDKYIRAQKKAEESLSPSVSIPQTNLAMLARQRQKSLGAVIVMSKLGNRTNSRTGGLNGTRSRTIL